ncbi:MAG: hypothetical protein AB8B91_07115 [Rubripirellula sp.]
MSSPANRRIDFADTIKLLQSEQTWEYETGVRGTCDDVGQAAFDALQRPGDFPPLEAAIVPGDRVALAVDPNVPGVVEVVQGAVKAIQQTQAGEIDVVIGEEATDETLSAMQVVVGDGVSLNRHSSSVRLSLRYLGADESADPIYLNRRLVDADFVLPIVAARPLDTFGGQDLTGIFPAFADSASRSRHRDNLQKICDQNDFSNGTSSDPTLEPSWLLGVQIILSVVANSAGDTGRVFAGTIDAARKELKPTRRLPDEFPSAAPLVIASLDGNQQQQTWANAARAVAAASRFVQTEGTIVLWSEIDEPPVGRLFALAEEATPIESEEDQTESDSASLTEDEDFPAWDEDTSTAITLARIAAENRLLIHSRLDPDVIETMGLGSVSSGEELTRLSQSFEACGVLRAAQFEGTTCDTPHSVPG